MSKFSSQIAIAALLVSLTGNVYAQVPTNSSPSPESPKPNPATTPAPNPTATPTATTPDLKLLGKAIGLFWQGNRATTNSQIVMTLQRKGTTAKPIQLDAMVKTISQTDDKFRSELTVARSGTASKITYSIVCDGKNVWMYRPDKRQYSKSTFAEFKPQFHSLLVGLSTVFFVSMSEAGRKAIVAEIAAGSDPLKTIPRNDLVNLKGNSRQVDGQNLYVYSFDNQAEKSVFNGFIQPETGILKQIEFVSNTNDADIKVIEKIVNHTTTNNLSNQLFRFSPPRGVKKVKSLSIDLLQLIQ